MLVALSLFTQNDCGILARVEWRIPNEWESMFCVVHSARGVNEPSELQIADVADVIFSTKDIHHARARRHLNAITPIFSSSFFGSSPGTLASSPTSAKSPCFRR